LIPAPQKQQPLRMQGDAPEVSTLAPKQIGSEPKVPKGDRPAVPTAKESPKGVAIPGKAEAKANAIAVRKASKQPGYKPTEEDAFHIVADAFNRGKLPKSHVMSATFDPKTGKWSLGENGAVPRDLSSPSLKGWIRKTQGKVNAGEIEPHDWPAGNCAEPNSLNNSTRGKPQSLEGKVVYTFEKRDVKITPGSPEREPRFFYKEPCRYCETLTSEGVMMPQHEKRLNRQETQKD
jgi:hypothetical protein